MGKSWLGGWLLAPFLFTLYLLSSLLRFMNVQVSDVYTRPFGEPDTDFALRWLPSPGMGTDPLGSATTGTAGHRGGTTPGVASEG